MERKVSPTLSRSRKTGDAVKAAESAQKQAVMLQSSAHAAREAVVQTTRYQQAAKAAQAAAQKASQAAGRALRAILSAARSLAAAMMAGGSTVLSMVLVICLIGLLIASPFGIFFSGEDSGTGYTMPEAVTMLNAEFTDRIEQIKVDNPYDELDMDNAGSAAMVANWRDVLAIYAVRTTMDAASPDEVATLTEEKLDILRQIFWDMNAISYWVETISGDEDESDTVILHITVTVKDHLQMADEYRFNAEQHKLLEELMQPEYEELFMRLTGSYQDIALGDKEAAEIMKKAPCGSQRGAQAGGADGVSASGQGQLFLGRKEPCAWMGLPLGNANGGHGGRQLYDRNDAPIRIRLFRLCRLGVLQPVWRQLCHRPWRWSVQSAQLLHRYFMERCPAGRPCVLSGRQPCRYCLWI